MKRIALTLLALATPRLADAGHTCGGHNGGGGGGSSSSGSSGPSTVSSSNDTSWSYRGGHAGVSSEVTTGCIDDTDVVGFRHCTKYGAWAGNLRLPRMFIELGSNIRQFTSGLPEQQGQVTHGLEQFAYRVVMADPRAATDTAVSSTLRFGFLPGHNIVYTAVELELGGLASTASTSTEMMSTGTFGGPQLVQQGGLFLGAYGVLGARGSTGRGTLAVEAAGGARSMMYHFDSSYHECETTSTITVTRAVVEARARAELWAGPWFTFGATVGANVLAKGDWLAGLYFGVHSRAFAGSR